MKPSTTAVTSCLTLWAAMSVTAGPAFAEPPPAKQVPAGTVQAKPSSAAGANRSEPAEHHRKLKAMIGTWEVLSRKWTGGPGAMPIEERGLAEKHMILGDRFLQEDYTGTALGKPHIGHGITGYDLVKQQYVNTWVCTRSTQTVISEVTVDAATKDQDAARASSDRPTMQNQGPDMAIHIASENKHIHEYYETGPDGKKRKTIEIVYTRKL